MNYNEFEARLLEDLRNEASGRKGELKVVEVPKPNTVLHGVTYTPKKDGVCVVPTVYVENYYKDYQVGVSYEAIYEEAYMCLFTNKYANPMLEKIGDMFTRENIVKYVLCNLISTEGNTEFCKEHITVPSKMPGLSLYFYVPVEALLADAGMGKIRLCRKHLDGFNLDVSELEQLALEHVAENSIIYTVTDDVCGNSEEMKRCDMGMRIISNYRQSDGAASVLSCAKEISKELGCDICLFAPNVHTFVAIPYCESDDTNCVSLLAESFVGDVPVDEVLSNGVWKYVRSTGEFILLRGNAEAVEK